MERRMKGEYLDQQVPYTFCSVSAAPASTPAPSLHPAPTHPAAPTGSRAARPGVTPGPQPRPPDQAASG